MAAENPVVFAEIGNPKRVTQLTENTSTANAYFLTEKAGEPEAKKTAYGTVENAVKAKVQSEYSKTLSATPSDTKTMSEKLEVAEFKKRDNKIVQLEQETTVGAKQIEASINKTGEPLQFEKQTGFYRYNTGVFVAISGYSAIKIPVVFGTNYLVSSYLSSAQMALVVLFDKNDNYIGYLNRGTGTAQVITDAVISPTSNVGYIAISSSGDSANVKKEIYESKAYNKEFINENYYKRTYIDDNLSLVIGSEPSLIPIAELPTKGYYKWDSGAFTENSGYKSTELLPVNEGDTIYITGATRSGQTSLFHTFDSEKKHVSYELRGDGTTLKEYNDYIYTVPKGVFYIGVSSPIENRIVLKKDKPVSKSYTKEESDAKALSKISKYGVRWNLSDPKSLGERMLDAVGLNAVIGIGSASGMSDFDNIYPWSEIKRCNLKINTAGAKVITYEGDAGFSLDGTNGDVFVRIPKFYIEKYVKEGWEYRVISEAGATPHSLFVEDGKVLDEVFISAFEGFVDNGKLKSKGGVIPTSNITPAEFLAAAKANGIGYTLYDMRCVDAIWTLMTVEYGCRNSNRVIGYGLSDFVQPIIGNLVLQQYPQGTNTIKITYPRNADREAYSVGTNITICKRIQSDILAQRKITNIADNGVDSYEITFSGNPVIIDTNDCFVGSAAQDANWCQSVATDIVGSEPLSYHTGRAKRSDRLASNQTITLNPCRYRWIENPVGNLWHYLPDVSFLNQQMYVSERIADYEFFKTTGSYKPVGDILPLQKSNGHKSDIVGYNFWVTKLLNDTFSKGNNFGNGDFNKNQLSSDGFGGFFYLDTGARCVANGGGFDHLWRCNLCTNRAWIDANTKWYLYGARLLYKNI